VVAKKVACTPQKQLARYTLYVAGLRGEDPSPQAGGNGDSANGAHPQRWRLPFIDASCAQRNNTYAINISTLKTMGTVV